MATTSSTTAKLKVPARVAAATKVHSIEVFAQGRGRVLGVERQELASFKLARQKAVKSRTRSAFRLRFDFHRVGGEELICLAEVLRNEVGVVTVEGTVNRAPFRVQVSGHGERLGVPRKARLIPADRRIFEAMVAAFDARASAHFHRGGCALAGLEIVVSALMLHPVGIAFGFAGLLLSC